MTRRLGRYELIQLLAKGGMGEVHLARTRGPGGFERLVVVKCALPALADQQHMMLAEARLAATLQHTNIVQVHDVGTDGETVFLAMEYLHGQDLRAVVRRSWGRGRPLALDPAIAMAIAVCAGLHYVHDKLDRDGSPLEIVHRDVSPSNVFATYDGGVKLLDFGIAKSTALPSDTQLGTLKGKPGYMSPEQCRCEPLDRRSDVFCVGILLYELTTGRRAFRADNEYLLNKQIIEEHPARPASLAPGYPAALEAIVMRALAKDRRERPPTALALQDELAAFARAQRLDLSQLALGRLMADLFADELAAWHEAQRAGQSLVEHVIKRTTTTVAIVAEPTGEATGPAREATGPTSEATGPAGEAAERPTAETVELRAPGRSRRRWIAGAVAAAAVAASAIAIPLAVSARGGATPEEPAAVLPGSAAALPPPPPPAVVPAPAADPAPRPAPAPTADPTPAPDPAARPAAGPARDPAPAQDSAAAQDRAPAAGPPAPRPGRPRGTSAPPPARPRAARPAPPPVATPPTPGPDEPI